MSRKHIVHPKVPKCHSTIIECAEKLVRKILLFPEVTKVILREIVQSKGSFYIKFSYLDSGLLLRMRGSSARQTIIVCTRNKPETQKKIEELYRKETSRT